MIWGEALCRAYELEGNVAIYPRTIIDSCVISEIQRCKKMSDYLQDDFDNRCFLNYMTLWYYSVRYVTKRFELMQDELRGIKHSDKVHQKLCCHMNYINGKLDNKKERGKSIYRFILKSNIGGDNDE